jgi:nucleoside-diphosphate-sugar epimerase
MREVVVTGGSGKAGRAVVRDLLEAGYDVLSADIVEPGEFLCEYIKTDLTDLGETLEVLRGAERVVHLAAIPAPGRYPEGETFRNNTISTYNVFSAATSLGAGRVVWASSETTLGLPFDREKPAYAPIDEDDPLYPESSYALSKTISEEMARQFSRTTGTTFAGACASTTSWWHPTITRGSSPSKTIRGYASGTCGVMWTPATWPRPAASRWRRSSREPKSSSWRRPTRSWKGGAAI